MKRRYLPLLLCLLLLPVFSGCRGQTEEVPEADVELVEDQQPFLPEEEPVEILEPEEPEEPVWAGLDIPGMLALYPDNLELEEDPDAKKYMCGLLQDALGEVYGADVIGTVTLTYSEGSGKFVAKVAARSISKTDDMDAVLRSMLRLVGKDFMEEGRVTGRTKEAVGVVDPPQS